MASRLNVMLSILSKPSPTFLEEVKVVVDVEDLSLYYLEKKFDN